MQVAEPGFVEALFKDGGAAESGLALQLLLGYLSRLVQQSCLVP